MDLMMFAIFLDILSVVVHAPWAAMSDSSTAAS